jgi:hypothetical protein
MEGSLARVGLGRSRSLHLLGSGARPRACGLRGEKQWNDDTVDHLRDAEARTVSVASESAHRWRREDSASMPTMLKCCRHPRSWNFSPEKGVSLRLREGRLTVRRLTPQITIKTTALLQRPCRLGSCRRRSTQKTSLRTCARLSGSKRGTGCARVIQGTEKLTHGLDLTRRRGERTCAGSPSRSTTSTPASRTASGRSSTATSPAGQCSSSGRAPVS